MGNESSTPQGVTDGDRRLPAMVLILESLLWGTGDLQAASLTSSSHNMAQTSLKGLSEQLPVCQVMLDQDELARVPGTSFPSRPLQLRSRSAAPTMRLRFLRLVAPGEDPRAVNPAEALAEVEVPLWQLTRFGAPLYASLWLGLREGCEVGGPQGLEEARKLARKPSAPKIRITVFKPQMVPGINNQANQTAQQAQSARDNRLKPDTKGFARLSGYDDACLGPGVRFDGGPPEDEQVEGLLNSVRESGDVVRTLQGSLFEVDEQRRMNEDVRTELFQSRQELSLLRSRMKDDDDASRDRSNPADRERMMMDRLRTELDNQQQQYRLAEQQAEIQGVRLRTELQVQQGLASDQLKEIGRLRAELESQHGHSSENVRLLREELDSQRALSSSQQTEIARLRGEMDAQNGMSLTESVRQMREELEAQLRLGAGQHAEITRLRNELVEAQLPRGKDEGDEQQRRLIEEKQREIVQLRTDVEAHAEDGAAQMTEIVQLRAELSQYKDSQSAGSTNERGQQAEIARLKDELGRQEVDIARNYQLQHEQELQRREAKIQSLEAQVLEAKRRQGQYEGFEEELDTLRSENLALRGKKAELKQKTTELEDCRQQLSKAKAQVESGKAIQDGAKSGDLRGLLKVQMDLAVKTKAELEKVVRERELERVRTEALKVQVAQLQGQLEQMRAEQDPLMDSQNGLQGSLARKEQELAAKEQEVDNLKSVLQDTARAAQDMKQRVERMEMKDKLESDLRMKGSKREEEIVTLQEKLIQAQCDCQALRQQLEEPKAEATNKNGLDDRVSRAILQLFWRLLRERSLGGLYQDVSEFVKTSVKSGVTQVSRFELQKMLKKSEDSRRAFSTVLAFKKLDLHGTGRIAESEFQQALQRLGMALESESALHVYLLILLGGAEQQGSGGDGLLSEPGFSRLFGDPRIEVKDDAAAGGDRRMSSAPGRPSIAGSSSRGPPASAREAGARGGSTTPGGGESRGSQSARVPSKSGAGSVPGSSSSIPGIRQRVGSKPGGRSPTSPGLSNSSTPGGRSPARPGSPGQSSTRSGVRRSTTGSRPTSSRSSMASTPGAVTPTEGMSPSSTKVGGIFPSSGRGQR